MIVIGAELSTIDTIIVIVVIAKLIDLAILVNECNDLSFLNPIRNYKKWTSLNWFGITISTLALNIFHPILSVGYWFYKLCTVRRKST